jgi:hypothetical protein
VEGLFSQNIQNLNDLQFLYHQSYRQYFYSYVIVSVLKKIMILVAKTWK